MAEGAQANGDATPAAEESKRRVAGARWYVIHTHSNFEKQVATAIREQARAQRLDALIEDIVVPTEEVIEVRRGEKRKVERRFLPGYVLIRMRLTDDLFHLIKGNPKVTGFLGPRGKPSAIPDSEAMRIMRQVREGIEKPKPKVSFEIGEEVRVKEGPFTSFNGVVEDVDEARGRVKVSVSIFGRATPVELEFHQVEKV
ncbi:MAG: transcription termination/antitermination protein NusG [Alphaproteobacteria bacterium]|nr:MAG: transcription termination/antitermination protein NusG [Alphaproteobacteria bacterium]